MRRYRCVVVEVAPPPSREGMRYAVTVSRARLRDVVRMWRSGPLRLVRADLAREDDGREP
jgi:hypothetical protein